MMISAGIDASTFDKTVDLINEQIKAMENGEFDESNMESAKLSIKTSYRELLENPYTIINSYESSLYLGFDSIKKRCSFLTSAGSVTGEQDPRGLSGSLKVIDKVTKEEIIAVAKKIKLNTIYLLEGTRR